MFKQICIIPFYNEEHRINHLAFLNTFSNNRCYFILVNDGSTDNTFEILNSFSKTFDNVEVLNNGSNLGKAESIRLAVNFANIKYQPQYVGFFDSDFATPFSEFLRLLDIANQYNLDLVFGSRVKLLGNNIIRNKYRHVFSRIVVTIINILFNLNIYDTQCGCKIFSHKITEKIFYNKFITKWLFDIELFIRYFNLSNTGLIKEVNLSEWKEIPGSKLKFKDFIYVPVEIFRIWFKYKFKI
jgi:dolichyl-phosphate beta-glucosyltransferase